MALFFFPLLLYNDMGRQLFLFYFIFFLLTGQTRWRMLCAAVKAQQPPGLTLGTSPASRSHAVTKEGLTARVSVSVLCCAQSSNIYFFIF